MTTGSQSTAFWNERPTVAASEPGGVTGQLLSRNRATVGVWQRLKQVEPTKTGRLD
ncbi:hypothetical protein TBK1r_29610 [Stieleria magnilauensis]|uniref:Uncharacterized protein n=1 Tax=Stieleria magnilauensis TaxID=2527963 RepID=A0ABX5XPS7_9BACT|nr:hypothetical protein TBK1r_29610 [Planctomycetes bacterium TBK1r]